MFKKNISLHKHLILKCKSLEVFQIHLKNSFCNLVIMRTNYLYTHKSQLLFEYNVYAYRHAIAYLTKHKKKAIYFNNSLAYILFETYHNKYYKTLNYIT